MQECITLDGTAILCELVSDEQDDELSERAFECLQQLGPEVSTKILVKIGAICENRRPYGWKSQKSLILDIFNRQERHILLHRNSG